MMTIFFFENYLFKRVSLLFFSCFIKSWPKHSLFLYRQTPTSNWRQSSRDCTSTGNPFLQGGMVPCCSHHRSHRWWPHLGPPHHVGPAYAPQRKPQTATTAARNAVSPSLQLSRPTPYQGSCGKTGLRVYGSGRRPWELLLDLRQDSTVWS